MQSVGDSNSLRVEKPEALTTLRQNMINYLNIRSLGYLPCHQNWPEVVNRSVFSNYDLNSIPSTDFLESPSKN